jgi:hypothetical protein
VTSTQLIGGDRPIRGCDVCGGVDDHPRHVIAGAPGAAGNADPVIVRRTVANCTALDLDEATASAVLAGIMDTSSQDRHRDCCRSVGCPTGTCNDVADLVGDKLRGADLLDATMATLDNPDEHDTPDPLQARYESRQEG